MALDMIVISSAADSSEVTILFLFNVSGPPEQGRSGITGIVFHLGYRPRRSIPFP
jgi:hypothetical protein